LKGAFTAAVGIAGSACGGPLEGLAAASQARSSLLPLPSEAKTFLSREYGRKRIEKVKQAIRRAGLDALVVSNRALNYLSYVSNFGPYALQPGVALIPAEGTPSLFVQMYSTAHVRAAKSYAWIENLVDVPRDPVSEGSCIPLLEECAAQLKSLHLDRAKIGLAGDEMDGLLIGYFREQLPGLHIEDGNRTLSALVVVKDEVELALMRHAQRLIDEVAFPAYREQLVPGAVDTHAFAEVFRRLLEAGADANSLMLFDAGPYGSGTWAAGTQRRKLLASDIVISEPMPSVLGYQTEKAFVFALQAKVPESQKRGAQVMYDAFEMSREEFRPGRDLASIIEKCTRFIRSKGYEGPTVPLGHWIGTQNHEGPRFTPEGTRGWVLQTGMVISWHPSIVVPGQVRACCSDCFLITDKAAESMSRVPMKPMYLAARAS
jgi:Xaa-Pro aminopeptidase